jgi:RND family efflux transporter MFP subunit
VRLGQSSAALAFLGIMLAAGTGVASAQQPVTSAQAAPSKPAEPKPAESKAAEETKAPPAEPQLGWFARQWQLITAMFSPAPERGRAPAGGQAPGAPPPLVTISQPVAREIVEWDEYTGRFDAVDFVEVRARVSGFLTEVHFTDGQMVKKGDPLFTLDARPFERALESAKAELAAAKTKVESTMKDVVRGKPLVDRRIISEKVFDDRENLKREAEAAVDVAEAKVRTAELDLSFTKIISPLDGRASRNLVSVGNYVTGGGAGTQTLLTTIVTQDPIQFYFDVSENNTIKYKRLGANGGTKPGQPGAAIEIALPDDKGFPHTGRLDFTDNRLDNATGTLRARAVLENKAGLFTAGMFGRARIAGSQAYRAVMLPDDAIGTDQANKFVYTVAEDGTVARKVVTLGPINGGLRIVRTGLAAEDWVVIKGLQRARPGQKVTPKREPLQVSIAPAGAAPAAVTQQ